jgi:Transposase DDE domain
MICSHPGGTIPLSSIDESLTVLYVFVDDFLQARPDLAAWRHSPNQHPAFSDAEVLTIALMQSDLQVASLKQTYRLIAANSRAAFPRLCSYARWIARVHALTALLGALLRVTTNLTPEAPAFYLIDAKPLPLCHPVRHRRVRLLREDGARFGKTSKGWFFGFKLHVLRHIAGRIVNLVLSPGNWDDREPALGLALGVPGGITLGDLGYRGAHRAAELAEEADMFLLTRAEAPTHQLLLTQVREAVETTFSQLWYKFLDRIFARSWHGLWHTVPLKVIHYNLRQARCLPVC